MTGKGKKWLKREQRRLLLRFTEPATGTHGYEMLRNKDVAMKPRPIRITMLAVLLALNIALFVMLAAEGFSSRRSPMAFINARVGIGFWRLKNWVRIATLSVIAVADAHGDLRLISVNRANRWLN